MIGDIAVSEFVLRTREQWEQQERRFLAAYAVSSSESAGRQYDEPAHPYRSCFQRDRDRVIHSAAFRRLEAKTQVFVLGGKQDYYRTRLTHTMEVAQIARTMARVLSANEDLAEAAALAHDLGHPPYGHTGEAVLNELMAGHGGFEHNRHSLRIVEYLEHPYPSFRGLNLCYETRECLAKHESRYDHPDDSPAYGPGQAPLEGQIADLADTIAYDSHDLDDALVCGLVEEADLADVRLYQALKAQLQQQYPGMHRFARQIRCAKGLIDMLVSDALSETERRLGLASPAGVKDVRAAQHKMVTSSTARHEELQELESFLLERVYMHPSIATAHEEARKQVSGLFKTYLADPSLLPQRYQQRIDQQGPHQVVCDYLAGMTDRFCRSLAQSDGRPSAP